MATANTTSPRKAKAGAKSARKSAAGKTTSARRSSAARNSTSAKASQAKGARTRTAHQAEATLRQAETATRETVGVFGDYAERAVLIPIGAALIARERVVASVNDTISSYGSTSRTWSGSTTPSAAAARCRRCSAFSPARRGACCWSTWPRVTGTRGAI